jgi:curli biogenesis system outer membrane secretion channel CsgG
VLPFSGNDEDLGTNVADALGTELLGMGFDLVERTQIEEILREQKFQLTGAVTPEKAKKIGQLAEIDGIITGSVSPFLGSGFVWGGDGQIANANIRLIDTESGQIAFSSSYKNGEINATFQRFNRSISVIAKSIANSLSR